MITMDLMRKCCTRCNKGIYTSWRTLDDKKYYHPHCFSCVDCGVILESIPEFAKATATSHEIYCGRCYNERVCANKKNQRKYDNYGFRAPASIAIHETSGSARYNPKKLSDDNNNSNNNVNVLFSSPSPFIQENCQQEDDDESSSMTIESIKKKANRTKTNKNIEYVDAKSNVLKKEKSESPSPPPLPPVVVMDHQPSQSMCTKNEPVIIERKSSRIPRPPSAQSKKSLITSTTATKVKPGSGGQTEKVRNSKPRPPPFPARNQTSSKMHRSISLVQPRNTESLRGAESSTVNGNGSIKSAKSMSLRPRSALTSTQPENSNVDNHQQKNDTSDDHQCVTVKTSGSKRQCAATFSSTKRKKKQLGRKQSNEFPDSVSNVAYPEMKGGIPSTQAILTAIRREGSTSLPKPKSPSEIKFNNNSESYSILNPLSGVHNSNFRCLSPNNVPQLPKRSFNMTFECPICISSLIPGCNNNEKCPDLERNPCRNVVTPCGHLFHGKCMDNWLQIKGNKRCPICSAICLPETLQPVYLECNLCADLNNKTPGTSVESYGLGMDDVSNASFRTLRSEFELLKAKYNAVLAENHNNTLNASLANSLQSAYDMECRNRLQLQWENRKLLMKIEDMKNSKQSIQSMFDL